MTATVTPPKERLSRGSGSGLGDPWRVIVLNDDHNTFEGVAFALAQTIPGVDYDKGMRFANKITPPGRRRGRPPEAAELYHSQPAATALTMVPLELSASTTSSASRRLRRGRPLVRFFEVIAEDAVARGGSVPVAASIAAATSSRALPRDAPPHRGYLPERAPPGSGRRRARSCALHACEPPSAAIDIDRSS
jgi:ATP-dependent Clp protease adaptor protein ClpS